MSKQMVHCCCRQFSEGHQSVHDEERSGRPSLMNVDQVEPLRQHVMENHRFTITQLSSQFPQIPQYLLHEIVSKHPRGEAVNVGRYCETLLKLRRDIQNKRRGILNTRVVLLHNNARPQTVRRTTAVLTQFCWELFDQPPAALILLPAISTFSCTSTHS
ncbi:HTH_48 domain-containing protein [Trichonephila clavipes]|uniref:HTH_48 domain-containing protein n=1 Tax=Trichonephila clavipes TaxID=2585209 RepID=A0A8X6UU86_TRICX|nr:HTH_48 domain-containing protein [Trichonephila clavipes]